MAVEIKQLLGLMDIDSPNETIPPGAHRDARNIVWRGPKGNMRAEVLEGTTEIVNPFLPADGVNKNIGSFYDPVNHQIISFNYNSLGTHAIYLYSTIPGTWQTIIAVGSTTDGDILGFTLDQMITSVAILYTEATDGNLLFYIDTIGRPTCLNIQRYSAVSPPYTPIKRDYIDLAKAPPIMVPQVTYENDFNATVNNLLNVLFQFKSRFVYDDYQKSVLSSGSIVPLPTDPFDQINDSDPTQNSLISVYVSTGDADVKKIEIWGQSFTDGGGKSDYYLIASLDKNQLNIPDNDVYRFEFRNDSLYLPGDIQETTLLQDWVPQKGNALGLLNGNVPVIGGIVEGYDNVGMGMNLSDTQQYPYSRINGLLFFASQGGYDSVGIGDQLKIVLTGAYKTSANTTLEPNLTSVHFVVKARDNIGNEIGFQYISSALETTASILNGLQAAAISAGFAFISQSFGELVMEYGGGYILESSFNTSPNTPGINQITFAYADQDSLQFGIQYFDEKGRTNGTSLAPVSSIKTMLDNTGATTNSVQINITSRPPIWARYYDIVRADEIGYNKRTFWISNQTFIDVDLNTNIRYVYIGISYMADYNRNIEASTPSVAYDFAAGDRVQFQIRYANDLTPNNLPAGLDYEIQALVTNPILGGVVQQGQFIKIIFPTNDISLTFTFGSVNFEWYKILIYSLKKHVQDSGSQTFFEFGKRWGIANAGTPNACHMAERQSQTSDLVTPAINVTQDGNYFYRTRNVPVGEISHPDTGSFQYSDRYANVPVSIPGGAISTADYDLNNVTLVTSNTNNEDYTSGNNLFFNKSASPITIRISGEYPIFSDNAAIHNMMLKICPPANPYYFYLVKNFTISLTQNQNSSYNTKFDFYVQIPPNSKVFLVSSNNSIDGNISHMSIGVFAPFVFTISKNILIPIIEQSFSDNYNIVTNSNSRPSVFDENAKQVYYPTLIRWGLADQLNTNINQTNRFYPQNFDELDKSHGAIRRIIIRDREARWYQERRVGRSGIYSRFIQDNNGNNILITTNDIITRNNVEYYVGEFGIGNQPASLMSAGFDDYFVDPVKGFALRVSPSGLDPISEQNRVQTWAGKNLPKYLNNYAYQFGGNSQVIGCFWFCNDRPGEALFATQAGSIGADTIPGEIFSFREDGNAWGSFYDINPDNLVCAENDLYAFYNGRMFFINNKTTYANFFGTQFRPSITLVFNDKIAIKKTFLALAYQSNNFWTSDNVGDIVTSQPNPQTGLQQISNLIQADYEINEGLYYAALMRDGNSMDNQAMAICEGDVLKGTYIVIKMSFNGSSFIYLFSPYLTYIVSPRNL